MLERLERADGAAELGALRRVAHGFRQAPFGDAQLLRGEQAGAGEQGLFDGGAGAVPGGQEAAAGTVEDDVAQGAGEVERGDRVGADAVRRGLDRVERRAVGALGTDEEEFGARGVGDRGHPAGQGTVRPGAYGRFRQPARGGGQRDREDTDGAAAGERGERRGDLLLGVVAAEQGGHRDDRAGQIGDGRDGAAHLLQHHGGLAGARARSAELFGHQQPRGTDLRGERAPQSGVVGDVRLQSGEHGGRIAAVGEQRPYGGAQRVLVLGVQQIGVGCRGAGQGCPVVHRGRSFHATSLSVRGSGGSPSTRSATMLSSTSEVPPSMEFPLARR